MVHNSKSAHLGSALSTVDLLTCLYFRYLRLDPKNPADPVRDRFILSKGHAGSGLYATLAERGYFPVSLLDSYGKDGSTLAVHPSSHLVAGIEVSTGSLGHGLSVGLGMALAGRLDGKDYRTVVMVSDGECDEGSTWEAILAAGAWKIDSLTCIVDYNKIQSFGRTADIMDLEPFADKWRAFGWDVQEVDGHDHSQILGALRSLPSAKGKPSVIIAHTIKGKGASWMEDTVESHYLSPSPDQMTIAEKDLSCAP